MSIKNERTTRTMIVTTPIGRYSIFLEKRTKILIQILSRTCCEIQTIAGKVEKQKRKERCYHADR